MRKFENISELELLRLADETLLNRWAQEDRFNDERSELRKAELTLKMNEIGKEIKRLEHFESKK